MPKLLTITEVSEMLRVSPNTINFWLYKGTGPRSVKIGRRRLWPEDGIAEWVEAHATPAKK